MMLLLLALQSLSAEPAAPVPAPTAPWTVREGSGEAANSRWASTSVMSDDHAARLAFRCDRATHATLSLQFATRSPLAAADPHPVTLTIDGAARSTADWAFPGHAAVLSDPDQVQALAAVLADAHAITVTTTDGGAPVTATLPGPAGTSAIARVLAVCAPPGTPDGAAETPPPAPADAPLPAPAPTGPQSTTGR